MNRWRGLSIASVVRQYFTAYTLLWLMVFIINQHQNIISTTVVIDSFSL